MAAFKDHVNEASVRALGQAIGVPDLDAPTLDDLELKARIVAVADALAERLTPFEHYVAPVADAVRAASLGMWVSWPAQTWVERHGLEHPEASLAAIATMTPTTSGEFAVRPFIDRYPDEAWRHIDRWATDDDEHVRRLASEGTRPRLPWGGRLTRVDLPRHLALLDRLHDDPSEYVRRSVANHLGDLAKDDPDAALATAERWMEPAAETTAWVVRHGLRDIIKKGDHRALTLIGADVHAALTATLAAPARATIGGELAFAVDITNEDRRAATAVVDYRVHYARPTGRTARKTFKLTTLTLEPGESRSLQRRLRLADVSIRTHHPGTHRIELLVNGSIRAEASFELTH